MTVNNELHLVAASAELLYDGMVVPHDIYDADAKLLLLSRGNTLNAEQIRRINRFNENRKIIQVSNETYDLMIQNVLTGKVSYQSRLEEKTGYTDIKEEALALLLEIHDSKKVSQESIHNLSEKLSSNIESTKPDLIISLINSLAPVGEYLQRHSINVGLINGLIGKWMRLPAKEIDLLVMAGLLHDCGKAHFPPQLLNAPRSLSAVEFEALKFHPLKSYELLADFPDVVRDGALSHHEKIGGQGYPKGLKKNQIPLIARITSISDIYDAMVSRRAYKAPYSPFRVLAHLQKLRNSELDSDIVDIFLKNMPSELRGKKVVMSDDSIATIHTIDYDDFEFPLVKPASGTPIVKTTHDLRCVSMYQEGGIESYLSKKLRTRSFSL